MKYQALFFCTLPMIVAASNAIGSTLYGSTSAGGAGELWRLDPATGGGVQDIGPLNDSLGANYAVTGLAFHPATGVLYGSTGGKSGTSLLIINPATARVTVVGGFNAGGATMADIAFDSSGNLYGISSSGGANLYSININTGNATEIGTSGVSFTAGGGLAISPDGTFYSTPITADFGTYDPTSGAFTLLATPSSYPAGNGTSYAALAFDSNTLYGIDLGSPPHLVIFDTSGDVTDIGPTPLRIDGIAFQPPVVTPPSPILSIEPASNSVVVGWISTATFRLQQNTNITGTNWGANTNPITSSGSTNQVVVPATSRNLFFRLIYP